VNKNTVAIFIAAFLAFLLAFGLFFAFAPPEPEGLFASLQHGVDKWRNDFSWRVNDWRNDFSWRVDDMREGYGRGINNWADDFNWRMRDWSEDFNRRVEDMTTYGLFGIIGRFFGLLSDILSNIGLVIIMAVVFLISARLLGGATLAAVLIWFLVSFHHGIRVGTVAGGAVLPLILFAPRLFSVSKAYLTANRVKIPS
jgi:hypothetical protein